MVWWSVVLWILGIIALLYLAIRFWKIALIVLGITILISPVFYCGYKYAEQKYPEKFAEKISPVNITGSWSFLNPPLTFLKQKVWAPASGAVEDFVGGVFSRIVGFRTLTGELRCTYYTRYLRIGALTAFWIFLVWIYYFASRPAMRFALVPQIVKIWTGQKTSLSTGTVYTTLKKSSWLFKISDKWWKSLVFILGYTYLMSFIPIINQIIRVLTLEIFMPNWFIQSLIIAFEIGFLPAMIEEIKHYKKKQEVYKKKLAEKVYEKAQEAWFK